MNAGERNPYSHLESIEARLSHERERVRNAKSARDREWRKHNCRMIEKERDSEIAFLEKRGFHIPTLNQMTDDELLRELGI